MRGQLRHSQPRAPKIPCIFPHNREMRNRDRFADDCLHRQCSLLHEAFRVIRRLYIQSYRRRLPVGRTPPSGVSLTPCFSSARSTRSRFVAVELTGLRPARGEKDIAINEKGTRSGSLSLQSRSYSADYAWGAFCVAFQAALQDFLKSWRAFRSLGNSSLAASLQGVPAAACEPPWP